MALVPDLRQTMVDTLTNMEEEANRRAAAILAGSSPIPLQDGPKWIGRISSDRKSDGVNPGYPLQANLSGLLLAMRPANVMLSSIEPYENGWLAKSTPDSDGKYSGYVYIDGRKSIEMVGVLHVGPWLTESRTWWPGVYELQLLKELPTTVKQLISQLELPAPLYLFMNLVDVSGTAIVTESDDGIERPFPIPTDSGTIGFTPVLLDKLTYHESVVNALNKIRRVIGLKISRPFYL
ncbi:hypothetical protein [Burkholderia sp. Bp8984]|uniref:hypothetical protein n=1 Tax=Burkholderia sp. Bp8984 TaxID=2184549 RepID=UPI000F5A13BA|nr:hypothetical protein [Burkholderia sp. Bp8984]